MTGPAYGHGGRTRSGAAATISTASARANLEVTWVTTALTRSPGSACLTNTTGPCLPRPPSGAGLATHQPPCTASPTVRSSTDPSASSRLTQTIVPPAAATAARTPALAPRARRA